MLQNDFILREIEGLTRFLGKVLFHKQQETEELIGEDLLVSDTGFFRHTLFQLLSDGKLNEAENLLHEQIEDNPLGEYLQIALDFYARLNEMTDQELENSDFSREEIVEGLEAVKQYYVSI